MEDAVKRITPMGGILSTFGQLADMAREEMITGKPPERGQFYRDEWDNITVDTCRAFDTGEWETAIMRGGDWTVVEQYGHEDAKAGHDKWVQAMKDDPSRNLNDIDLWGLGLNEKD